MPLALEPTTAYSLHVSSLHLYVLCMCLGVECALLCGWGGGGGGACERAH